MYFKPIRWTGLLALASLAVLPCRQASAQLQLTAAGVAAGFSISTFATGFPSTNSVGPVGIAFDGGHVIVSDIPGNIRVFATDTDGQTAASAPIGQSYGYGEAHDVTASGGRVFESQYFTGQVNEINPDGSFKQSFVSIPGNARALVTDPLNNHLLLASNNVIYDISLTGVVTPLITINAGVDGITTDGVNVYGAVGANSIQGFSLSNGSKIFDSGFIGGGPDGGALGMGNLAGNIFVNTNDGHVIEINLATQAQTVIAQNGSRGDFVNADPNNGSLLLTQSSEIDRLIAPPGGGFSTPEPGPLALLVTCSLTSAGLLLKKRRQK